jgi:hypothetical protein
MAIGVFLLLVWLDLLDPGLCDGFHGRLLGGREASFVKVLNLCRVAQAKLSRHLVGHDGAIIVLFRG